MYFFNFIYSLSDTTYWDKLVNHPQTQTLVVNINSGPYATPSAAIDSTQISTTFVNYIAAIKAKNPLLKVLGYVNSGGTNYLQPDGTTHIFKGRWKTTNPWQNGTELTVNWNSGQKWDMYPQILYWYQYYGVDGIMFDNTFGGNIQNGGTNDATQNTARDTFYQTIYTGMRGIDPTKIIYFNCGGQWPSTWVDGTLGSGNPIFDKITVAEVNFTGNRAGYPRGDQYVSGNSGPFNTPQPNTAFPDSTLNGVLAPQVVARAQNGTFKYDRNLFVGLLTTGYVGNTGPGIDGNSTYTLSQPTRADMRNFMDTCYNNNIGNVYVSDTPAYNSYTAFPTIWTDDVAQGWGQASYVKFYADPSIKPLPSSLLSDKATASVIVDPSKPTQQLKINKDGSINVDILSGGGGGGSSSDVAIHDNTTTANHLKVNSDGSLNVNSTVQNTLNISDPTTSTNKLKVNSDGSINVDVLSGGGGSGGVVNIADPTTSTYKLKINSDGSINTSGGGGGAASSVTINDPTTTTQKLAVDSSGKIGINNLPTTQPVSGTVALGAGSALIGAVELVDSAGTNKAAIDASGNLSVKMTNSLASTDGQAASAVRVDVLGALSAGGAPLANALPSLNAVDRIRTYQGKGQNSYTITATAVGDTQLNCAAGALKTIYPGALVKLSGGAANEYVVVASSYTPATGVTAVPLVSPVVNASQTSATFDTFSQGGPQANALLPTGMLMVTPSLIDPNAGNLYIPRSATLDAQNASGYQGVVPVIYNGSSHDRLQGKIGVADMSGGGRSTAAIAAGLTSNTIVKASAGRIARILITVAGTTSLTIYDNASAASGTIIAITPATTTPGQVIDFGLPAANGIYVAGNAGNPGVTISYY